MVVGGAARIAEEEERERGKEEARGFLVRRGDREGERGGVGRAIGFRGANEWLGLKLCRLSCSIFVQKM